MITVLGKREGGYKERGQVERDAGAGRVVVAPDGSTKTKIDRRAMYQILR